MAWGYAVDDRALIEFRHKVRDYSSKMDGQPIACSSAAQAAIITERLFATAESSLRILTGGLNPSVYGADPVLVEAKQFLATRNSSLVIVFTRAPEPRFLERHPLLESLSLFKNVTIMVLKRPLAEKLSVHFTLADTKSYRFKTAVTSHVSVAGFGDVAFSHQLSTILDFVQQNSSTLEPAFA